MQCSGRSAQCRWVLRSEGCGGLSSTRCRQGESPRQIDGERHEPWKCASARACVGLHGPRLLPFAHPRGVERALEVLDKSTQDLGVLRPPNFLFSSFLEAINGF